jgi:hypothetical protein
MSHNIGRAVPLGTRIGPDSGPQTSPGVWELPFTPPPALSGGSPRFVILHFSAMSFPAGARLEVDVGGGVDAFDSGAEGWTRPIDPTGGPIAVRYLGSGTTGGVTLSECWSGEPMQTGTPGDPVGSLTNPDVFLHTDPYVEPLYESRLRCGTFDWENAACAAAGSVEAQAARAVCVLVSVHEHADGSRGLGTCSGTLIGPDLVLTAWHCANSNDDLEAASGSVCFGYATTCSGARPAGYAAQFHKVIRVVARGPSDWAVLQIETPPGGLGIAPRTLRPGGPVAGEAVFAVHHPHGAVKKLQRRTLVNATVTPVEGFDFAGGSSGSPLFDAAGLLVGGALSSGPIGTACRASYTPATTVLREMANPPAPPAPFDVMLVMDRSGSMSGPGTATPGRTKLQEARDAAALFVQLVRVGAGHRIGMVSFSSSANRPADSALGPADAAKKDDLVGPSPFSTGRIGGLVAAGATSIGDGLSVAAASLGPGSTNTRAVLLLTDGLQNTPPMLEAVETGLGDARLFAIGFGAEGDLDGPLLTRIARDHAGIYTRASQGLALKKFFSLAFGNIFEAGTLSDPELVLREAESSSAATPFMVCGETRLTVVLGWSDPARPLALMLTTPAGVSLVDGSPGVEAARGETWQFLKVPLPRGAERNGAWSWTVARVLHELSPPPADVRFFVNVIADGGPVLEPLPPPGRVYTGDGLTPRVALRAADGTVPSAEVELEIEAPAAALGAAVAGAGLAAPVAGDDPLSAFRATLRALGGPSGGYEPPTTRVTVPLYDDGEHDDGAMERDGIFANPLPDLTRYEGTYHLHARARFGAGCGRREALWSLSVELGIDAGRTGVEVRGESAAAGGGRRATMVFTPRDVYGSPLGPGRADAMAVSGSPGTTVAGPVRDRGDGGYEVEVVWASSASGAPGVVLLQPERPPVPLTTPSTGGAAGCPRWVCLLLAVALVVAIVVIALT